MRETLLVTIVSTEHCSDYFKIYTISTFKARDSLVENSKSSDLF